MRRAMLALGLVALTTGAQAQTVAAPPAAIANYDPTMSAKEAVLANWELAAAGIRAGAIVGARVVAMADTDASYAALAAQAQFAQKTMVQRFNAAQWIYAEGGVGAPPHAPALTQAVAAAATPCAAADCAAQRGAIKTSFTDSTAQLTEAAALAQTALSAREDAPDAVLMTEQLSLVARYLDSGDWGEDLALTDLGRGGEEMAARIVGAMSLWRNLEPYVGLANPEIDAAINAAAEQVLRTLRRATRGGAPLSDAVMADLRGKAQTLAGELRRAAALFAV